MSIEEIPKNILSIEYALHKDNYAYGMVITLKKK